MKRVLMTAMVVLVILAVGLVAAGCGSSKPFAVGGAMVRTSEVDDGAPVQAGSTLTVKATQSWNVTGDMVGSMEVKYTMPVDTTTGAITLDYTATFTGKIGDKSGTFTAHGAGTGQMTSQTDGTYTADETITGGTADFEGITGTMHVEGKSSAAGGEATYQGTLQYK